MMKFMIDRLLVAAQTAPAKKISREGVLDRRGAVASLFQ